VAVAPVRANPTPRSVSILGSTGSVGCNTIALIEDRRADYVVDALTAQSNVPRLAEQARRLRPRLAVIGDPALYGALKDALAGTDIAVAAGPDAIIEAALRPAEWVMAAIVGAAGLAPTLAAVRRGAIVGLANKECLVCAGELLMREARECGAMLLPVDSEHNAIFQVFDFTQPAAVERLILTASGGPFRTMNMRQMADVTPSQAVAHPNWDMGAKISVDSATLMNKGLEVIEAHHLFGLPSERIEVLVHPQSVVHSLVAYVDGSVLAQLGAPDMRTPIAYALGWPRRIPAPSARLDLSRVAQLTFEPPDPDRFPSLGLARSALQAGGTASAVLNAANEVAVQSFLADRIGFLDIARVVAETLALCPRFAVPDLSTVLALDREARRLAESCVLGLHRPQRRRGAARAARAAQ